MIDKPMQPVPTEPVEFDPTADFELDLGIATDGAAPVIVELEDGSVEITIGAETDEDALLSAPHDANLVEYLDEDTINKIATDLQGLVDADERSRSDWEETLVKGLETIGLKYEQRTMPWEDSCGVYSTVLAEAAIRFQAESMSETFPAAGPVKTKIIGVETPAKQKAAARVQADMNFQLTENMVEYRPEHERMLYSLGLMGSAFKKVYDDPALGRPTAVYISAEDVIVPYGASNIFTAERVTHRMRKTEHEMDSLIYTGFYADVELGEPVAYHSELEQKKAEEGGFTLTDDNRYTLLEIHTELRVDGLDSDDEPAKPYVVTLERGSGKCLSIRRNWDEGDPLNQRKYHFTHYTYIPGFGFYGLGLIHLIGGYAMAGTSLIRQLVDAGTLSNLPGGLKTRGMRVKGDDTPISPGEFRDVDVPSGTLKENIMTLPYKEPSQVLFMLLERITDEGRRLGAISDMKISDMSAQAPVGTTLALLERTLKPMAAVQARVHYAMKQEFKLLKALIAENTPESYEYDPGEGAEHARREDYAMVEVIPVSDPNSSTMAQRVVQYQAALQMAQMAPQIYNLPQLHRQMLEVIGIKNVEKLVPTAEDATPVDPISENMNALVGKPLQAFMYQDHDAHIAAHTAFMQDPMIMQSIGQNPMAQQIMASLQAHLAEHLGFAYRRQMEERLGVTLPMPNEPLPPEVEVQLSRAVADGAQQLLQMHQQQAAQKQAQEQAADPAFQLEQQKVQIQGAEVQRKAAKDQKDAELKAQELALKDKAITTDAQLEAARLGVQVDTTDKKIKADVVRSAVKGSKPTVQRR
jgi:hypothetical protein